ncbi:division/cell wall cluster transcriptional repressor MraZ [Wenxinia marina]|uniref:Transcriptional regulator MraZ n=1 Tax=Wenxinia marina DSM 24838 TaxID=1123501 RepID=A0A0D0Q5H0_9RHOB|nr:division/cell wall cluster transcriptional repressor MraZ [Wenxinia marina]KIQ69719.1 hypothetical protein Wenmar_02083 [Wenxinia marina DSM 24838]GGL60674.1 transcriptional regulator MraZ [Wenxinia marina]
MAHESFTGEYTLKMDGKGRLSIPAPFRRVLEQNDDRGPAAGPSLYLLYGPHLKSNFKAYSVAGFRRIAKDIEDLPLGSPAKNRATQLILNRSQILDVDKDGRVVLPQRQREKRGMNGGELVLAGSGDHFDIWPSEVYERQDDDLLEWLDEQGEDFDPLSLLVQPGAG